MHRDAAVQHRRRHDRRQSGYAGAAESGLGTHPSRLEGQAAARQQKGPAETKASGRQVEGIEIIFDLQTSNGLAGSSLQIQARNKKRFH